MSIMAARLHQNVQDLAFAINGAPKINALAVNPDEDFIQMPAHIRTRVRTSQFSGIGQAKLNRPATNRFLGNVDPALGQQIFDVSEAQGKLEV
jgi:hypothetical protein